jgi:hypothetical protein
MLIALPAVLGVDLAVLLAFAAFVLRYHAPAATAVGVASTPIAPGRSPRSARAARSSTRGAQ